MTAYKTKNYCSDHFRNYHVIRNSKLISFVFCCLKLSLKESWTWDRLPFFFFSHVIKNLTRKMVWWGMYLRLLRSSPPRNERGNLTVLGQEKESPMRLRGSPSKYLNKNWYNFTVFWNFFAILYTFKYFFI